MKITFLSFLFSVFLFSNVLQAETGREVCEDISFSRVKEECLSFIRGRYIDIDAGYVCINARFNDGKFDCIKVSADKEYTLSEANTCHDESFDDDRIECMRNSGRQRDQDRLPSEKLRLIKRLANDAMEEIYDGDTNGALETLQRIKRLANPTK